MEWPDTKLMKGRKDESLADAAPKIGATLFVRLWAYGGPGEPLAALMLGKDSEISSLIADVIAAGGGGITRPCSNGVHASFEEPLHALATAKTLQQRLLTLHRPAPHPQIVTAVMVFAGKRDAASASDGATTQVLPPQIVLEASNAAQILVSEEICELARSEAGFRFSPTPVRDDAGSGAVYELFWTDESTYGHLREAGDTTRIRTAGRYEIQEELGRGNMGVVYKAYDQLIGRVVALKTIAIGHNAPDRRELIERLKREAKAAGGLDHPNIITIFDVGQEDDRLYLSMQFVEGKTLQAMLEEGQLPALSALVSYAEQICSAVDYAHGRGVVHRDLKPANLMLTTQGTIKVLDFGIAKIEDATLTQTGIVIGTPTHMAPEQVAGKKIDQRTDIFALGAVFYELFTREKPFQGDITSILYKIAHEDPLPPSIINPALPGGIDAIIRKALAKDPNERYQSCAEMGQAFHEQSTLLKAPARAAVATTEGSASAARSAPAKSSHPVDPSPARPRKRIWRAMAAVLVLAMSCVAGWSFYVKSRSGAFPPLVRRITAVVGRAFHRHTANGADATGSPSSHTESLASKQTQQGSGPADATPVAQPNSANAGSIPPAAADAAPPVQQNVSALASPPALPGASSTSTTSPGDHAQPSADMAPTATGTHGDGSKTVPDKKDVAAAPASSQTVTVGSPAQSKQNPVVSVENTPAPQSAPAADVQVEPVTHAEPQKVARKNRTIDKALKIEGFTRRDVPDLLRQANAAAERGDHRQARYEYTLILKLERNNAAARAGLRQALAAEKDQTH